MKKRFIILVDLSEYSGNLVRYAYDWSREVNAELLLVHQTIVVTPVFTESESKASIALHRNEEALQKMKILVKDTISINTNVSFLVSETNLQLILPNLLAEPYEHLLFVGLKGTGLLKKIVIGSVALQVIDNTNNSIVAIPKEISTFSHKKIFVAVTKKHPLNIVEFNNFLKFIDPPTTSITFFHLSKPNEKSKKMEKYLEDVSALFAERFTTSVTLYEGSNPFTDIKEVINNKVDEILVVQKGSRLLTDQLFRKFLINELVYEGQTPLVVLP